MSDGITEPFVHATAVVDDRVSLSGGVRIWHFSHVCEGATLGAAVSLGQNVYVGPGVIIGSGTKVQNNVSVYAGVTLAEDVFVGPSAVFTNVRNPRSGIDRSGEFSPTLIDRGATIGANATIICGHRVGEYALVGAGSVVARDVPAYALVVGVPARRVGWVAQSGERLEFGATDLASCPHSGKTYRLIDGGGRVEPA